MLHIHLSYSLNKPDNKCSFKNGSGEEEHFTNCQGPSELGPKNQRVKQTSATHPEHQTHTERADVRLEKKNVYIYIYIYMLLQVSSYGTCNHTRAIQKTLMRFSDPSCRGQASCLKPNEALPALPAVPTAIYLSYLGHLA